jgi:hypothetical protein
VRVETSERVRRAYSGDVGDVTVKLPSSVDENKVFLLELVRGRSSMREGGVR